MKKTAIISCAVLMVVAVTAANAQYLRKTPTVLEQRDFYKSPEREHIQNDRFIRIDSVDQFPAAVRNDLGDMGNPRDPWCGSCVGPWDEPLKRLIFAALSDDHLIVYFEQAYSNARLFEIYSFTSSDPMPLIYNRHEEAVIHRGGGSITGKPQNIQELKDAILASRAISSPSQLSTYKPLPHLHI